MVGVVTRPGVSLVEVRVRVAVREAQLELLRGAAAVLEGLEGALVDATVDTLLLGCTHYPFLARTISDVMGRDVVLVDSADETAFRVRALLGELNLARPAGERPGRHRFESSGDVEVFRRLGRRLLGPELDDVAAVAWA